MNIIFYKNTSENNKLNKVLIEPVSINGNFKNDVDIQNPVITTNTNLQEYNYCFIPSLNRYYFITKIELNRTNLYTIYLHIDVLETYKTGINNLNVIVVNSTSNPYYKGFINDIEVKKNIITQNFENNFNENGSVVLVAINGTRGV